MHCVGMCGGIIGALVYGMPAAARATLRSQIPYIVAYNMGRIGTYGLAGAIVGYIGFLAGDLLAAYRGWMYLRVLAGLFMVALGLYIGRWWFGLLRVERIGANLWDRVKPAAQRLLPVRHPRQAFALGLVWGWLPCGLVYSVLVWALAAGGWVEGLYFMLSFGAGTLPALLALGFASTVLTRALQKPGVRKTAGASVIVFGLWTVAATLMHQTNVGLGCASPPT